MKKTLMMIMLAITGMYGTARAQQPAIVVSDKTGWHKIGEMTVNFEKDRDEMSVLGADRFASIKFKVKDAPIYLMDLEVYYESGDKQDINVNFPIKGKGESRVIDLDGGERSLKKIVFVYKTLDNRKDKRAHVEIWGFKTNAGTN
jgi:hypothetical protein